ncbi:MAG: carboxypeptidase-like regulatory domain-containing protein [Terracidiphilus sp.]
MKPKKVILILVVGACPPLLFNAPPVRAQAPSASISGTISSESRQVVANATVSITNLANGQSAEAHSDSIGNYRISNLMPGNYSISIRRDGFATSTTKVTLAADASQTLNFSLAASIGPSAPGASTASPSLEDLGFSSAETQGNPQLQAILQKRTEMLKIHQRLGLITAIPMTAALITGPMAKAKGKDGEPVTEPSQANLDFHAALGGATTALYFATAYYAVFAPRVPGTHKRGAIRAHEALAFVHGPGMILTPILGYMAYKQENAGEKVHGIASAHGAVAVVTAASYGAAIVAVSWPIRVKFWEKK